MTIAMSVQPGMIVLDADGNRYLVRGFSSPSKVLARNLLTNCDEQLALTALRPSSSTKADHRDLMSLPDEQLREAYECYEFIRPLLDTTQRTTERVDAVAMQAGVSRATIYRWLERYERTGLVSALTRKRRSDAGATRLDPKIEKLLGEVISGYYLDEQRRSIEHAHRELTRLCRREGIPAPAYNTLRARIEAIAPKERTVKRFGLAAAGRFNINEGTVPNVDYPYAVVQIDHTPIDVMLVDEEHRIAIGRPWLTVAIDVYSRMVAGYYVSFDPPGALGTGICIANAMLSKDSLLAKLGLAVSYPCMGKPRVIHVDNAKEFRGETLKRACMEYGIDLVFRRIKTPNYGGHIERHLGTLAGEIHALPGTTFSNSKERGDYDSEKRAAMTLPEFECWLGNLILGAYHYRPHSALGEPPIKRYTDGILGSDTQPGIGSIHVFTDEDRLRTDFLPIVERTIQHYGVAIDGIEYFADVLRRWVGAMEPDRKRIKRKFLFRRDPRDISFVLFYDPDARQYFRIPYRNTVHPPISLWELRATQRFLAEQGKRNVDETQIFAAYDEMRRIEESSKTLTRKVRLQQTRRKQHRAVNAPANAEPAANQTHQVDEGFSDEIAPFDEIERF